MTRWLYAMAMWLAQPLLRRKLAQRALVEPEYGEHIEQRFGYYDAATTQSAQGGGFVWVHAVSLGETRAAEVLIHQMRLQLPGMRLLLTHGTATGCVQGRALLQPGDVQVWQPWDSARAVRRFLAQFQPRLGLLIETEVWPTLTAECHRAGVPLCLVNARLNETSLKKAQRLAWLSRPTYAALTAVWAQSQEDADRLQQLGAPVRGVLGNFKFDTQPDAQQLQRGQAMRKAATRPVLMFASSREGEEVLLLQKFKQKWPAGGVERAQAAIKSEAIPVQLLIVPRHPQRFDEVVALCETAGYSVSRRSQWTADTPQAADVWIGDSVGEMPMYFGLADAALLGGSFAPLGGQNLIEAAACACPVIMGPHVFNFAQAAESAAEVGAAFAVSDMSNAVEKAMALLVDPEALAQARQQALGLSRAHAGAAKRTAEAVRALLLG
ncbi:MAG: 3-deoxy-D-manno-octulosonic acid transferase [Rhodoferax sp.]|nr:3-deoxy-D-manno-octulosonic acid transferase [Rhodoferax sp.]